MLSVRVHFEIRKKMEKLLSFFVLLKGPALTHH